MAGISIKEFEGEEPALSFYWKVDVSTLPEFNGIRPKEHWFLSVELPSPAFEAQPVYSEGTRKAFGGSTDALTFSVSCWLTDSYELMVWAQGWRELIRDSEGFYGLPADYKKDLRFFLQDTTGKVRAECLVKGAWLMNPQGIQVDYSQSQAIEYQLNFSCDDAQIKLKGTAPSALKQPMWDPSMWDPSEESEIEGS